MTSASVFSAALSGLALVASFAAHAQPAAPLAHPGPAAAPGDQRIERLSFEDDGARVDEVRVGGQTQSLTVQPKGGAPAYEIQPDNGQRSRGTNRGDGISAPGQRVWNVLKF